MRAAKAGPPGEIAKGNWNSNMPVSFAAVLALVVLAKH
jgi:hypothetical protein